MELVVQNNGQEEIEGITPEYPYVMHKTRVNDFSVPWHWHEELEFDYIGEGAVNVVTNNGFYSFKKGEAFFCNSNVLCKMENQPGCRLVTFYSHLFHSIFLGGHFKSIFETKYLDPVLNNKNLEILELRGETACQKKMLQKLNQVSLLQKKGDNVEFETRNLFSEIWLLLLEELKSNHVAKNNVDLKNQERILTMISCIHQHYSEKITLEAIAASADVSTRECLRCFQKNIGKTPFEYLMEYRIKKAEELLTNPDKLVVEVGYECGFSSNAYFGKKFREAKGMTPGEYRKMIWQSPSSSDINDVQSVKKRED